jgi:hypothetical protein
MKVCACDLAGRVKVARRHRARTLQRRSRFCVPMTRVKRRKRRQRFSAIKMRALNDPRQGSLPTVQTRHTVDPLACKPTMRHHPPNGAIKVQYKIVATLAMAGTGVMIYFETHIPPAGKITYAVFVAALLGFIWSRPVVSQRNK